MKLLGVTQIVKRMKNIHLRADHSHLFLSPL